MDGSRENGAPNALEAQAHESQGGLTSAQGASHIASSTVGSAAVQDAHSSLGYKRTEPDDVEQSMATPTPGFTSAFNYDPYVEIKDFLDALTAGTNFHIAGTASELSKATANGGSHKGEMSGYQRSASQQSALTDPPTATQAPGTMSQSLIPETTLSTDTAFVLGSPATEAIGVADAPDHDDHLCRESSNDVEPEVVASPPETVVPPEVHHDVKPQLGEEHGSETPQQTKSAEAIPASNATEPEGSDHQSLGFVASITASFAPQTKSAWTQLFGSRYEDEVESKTSRASSSHQSRDENQSFDGEDLSERRVSLKAKLECERRLDQQIQASQQRFKERSLRSSEPPNPSLLTKPQLSPKRHSSATAPIPLKPFEMAGLSITSVRFCVEKALQATCKCFQQLHALALNEPQIPTFEAEHGVFVSQWELEQVLQELFGAPQLGFTTPSLAGFALANPQYAGVPLELLLQITWFVPFDQLTRLRSLVLQITRKHLNEHKLAVLNRHLQKQLLLIPYSTTLQQVLLQFSGHRSRCDEPDEPNDDDEDDSVIASTAASLVHCTSDLVRELLECIAVPVPADLLTTLDDKDLLLLSPFELVQKWRLSSLLCIQRVIFFRFLVEAIASERSPNATESVTTQKRERLMSSSLRKTSQSIRSVQSRTRASSAVRGSKQTTTKKKAKPKAKQRSSSSGDSENESIEDTSEKVNISRPSITAIHGSATSVASSNNDGHTEAPYDPAAVTSQEQSDQRLHRLQLKLHASLSKLGDVMPWLHHSSEFGSPAIRATFLAASAFHQSLDIMIKSHLALDCDIMDKLQHFVNAIDALIMASDGAPQREPKVVARQKLFPHPAVAAAATVITRSDPSGNPLEKFPPPFPDLTRAEEKARFPPPYESVGASYWAFTPNLPTSQPAVSVAKSTTPPAIHPALYPVQPSPGVGAYDIQRGEQLTFQQRPGYSFRKAGIAGDVLTPSKDATGTSSSAVTPSKPRIQKGSAFSRQPSRGVMPPSYAPGSLDHEPSRRSVGIEVESVSMPESQDGDDDEDDERLEVDILNALRRQHNMVVNDFMNDIVLQNHQPSQLSPPQHNDNLPRSPVKAKATHSRGGKASKATEPKWRSSSESRFVNRMRGNNDAVPSSPVDISRHEQQDQQPQVKRSSTIRPQSAREFVKPVSIAARNPAKPRKQQLGKVVKMPLVNGPEQPNDEHLAWAARISGFYRAKQSLDNGE